MKRHLSAYIACLCILSPCVSSAQDAPASEQVVQPVQMEKAVMIDEASNLNLQIHNLAEQLVKKLQIRYDTG